MLFNSEGIHTQETYRVAAMLPCLLLICLRCAFPAHAFKRNTRCQIRDAIVFAPDNLQDYLVSNFEAVHKGIHHVDIHDKRTSSINPYDAVEIYQSMVASIDNGTFCTYNTSHLFGRLPG